MSTVTFDDGTTITTDDGGNVVAATDQKGQAVELPGRAGSSIVQQFTDLFTYGARSAIDSNFRGTKSTPAAVNQGSQGGAAGQLQRLMPALLLAAVVFVVVKLATK